MNLLDSVCSILHEAQEPLHYREITKRILAQGKWSTRSKTPEASVNAQLSTDIKQHGDSTRFRRIRPGVYALTEPEVSPQDVVPPTAQLSFLDAAERVLGEAGGPLHYEEITKRALAAGLIRTGSKTPAATLTASVSMDIRRRQERGEGQRFSRPSRGKIGLAAEHSRSVTARIEKQNREVEAQLLNRIRKGSAKDFEHLVAGLLGETGFPDVEVTRQSADGGIDVRGTLVVGDVVRVRMAVQAKRWESNVGAQTVREMRGSLGVHEQGLIITTSDFSPGARKEAKRADASPVALMDGEKFAALLAETRIGEEMGVERKPLVLLALGESDAIGEGDG